jgi:hypothetical protein
MEAVHDAGRTGKRIVIINRFETVTCQACGRRVARKSRQQKFCSDRCRDYARRENNARRAIKNSVLGQDTGRPTNPRNSVRKNNSLQGSKTGSSVPLNVLGGHRWANSITVERELLRKVVRAEIGAAP